MSRGSRPTPCRYAARAAAALSLLVPACGSSPEPAVPAPSPPATAADAGDAPSPPPPLPPIAARFTRPVDVPEWMVATIGPNGTDGVRDAIEHDVFDVPAEGDAYGTSWTSVPPGEGGALGTVSKGWLLYAAARFDLPDGVRLFARIDTALGVYANGAPEPGDVYGSKRIRVPLRAVAGSNLVVVRGYGSGFGQPQAQIWATNDEIVVGTADATVPDLVAGDASEAWIGLPVLNLLDRPVLGAVARVEASDVLQPTETPYAALPALAVTQVAFRVVPKAAPATPGAKVAVGVRIESPSLAFPQRADLAIDVVAPGATFRRTFRSPMDGSAQFYGVVPPKDFDPAKSYALVLSLHGAGVDALGQAKSYSPKDWARIVAATNRRPFGFDWEEFGRLDGIEVLENAAASWKTDPTRVYVTGHSMGGHGTWQLGTHYPGRFRTIGPSAGWGSFYTYTGATKPTGAIGRARAASDTLAYLPNLARRGAYVIQGTKDNNVPLSEAKMMVEAVKKVTSDVVFWEEPGAGHWWDGDKSPGVDCVDWPPLFDFMKARVLDPFELDFRYTTPSPWVNPRHSFVTIRSERDAWRDVVVESASDGDAVVVSTDNVRSLVVDGKALLAKGVKHLVVDRVARAIPDGPLPIGPQDGKRPGVHGPLNEVFQRPWCAVWPDAGHPAWARYAAFLVSAWNVQGNGQACALPLSAVGDDVRAAYNLVYVGVARDALAGVPQGVGWTDEGATVGGKAYPGTAAVVVFPDGDRLAAAFSAAKGYEYLLFRYHPFTSRSGLPDWFVWGPSGGQASGFFSPEWTHVPGK